MAVAITGCNGLSQRIDSTEQLALENGLFKKDFFTNLFTIVTYQRNISAGKIITIYVEGDGRAWINRRRVSANPTPDNPVALRLAIADNNNNVVYMARPCQYLDVEYERNCKPEYWTSKRASREIVDSLNNVISQLKHDYSAVQIRLVGYSGGATLAAILAATRDDVIDFRSIAGNLDIKAFTDYHDLTPLHGSINPVSMAQQLVKVPQQHYVSVDDKVVTPTILESYLDSLKEHDPQLKCIATTSLSGISHGHGWQTYWSSQPGNILTCQ